MLCICVSEIKYRIHGALEHPPAEFSDYLCEEDDTAIDLTVTPEDIAWEKANAAETAGGIDYERSAVLRKIATESLRHDRLLTHGACLAFEGKGYLFLAPSGTGKTTHIRLWKKHLGERVTYINGDKPLLRVEPVVTAYGSPWSGKEGYQSNGSAPLAALIDLRRAEENRITPMKKADAFSCLYRQSFMQGASAESTRQMLAALRKIVERVPAYVLECNLTDAAFFCSFEALTGKTP